MEIKLSGWTVRVAFSQFRTNSNLYGLEKEGPNQDERYNDHPNMQLLHGVNELVLCVNEVPCYQIRSILT